MPKRDASFTPQFRNKKGLSPLEIALTYLTVGILWVLLSDMALLALVPNPELLTRFQTVKNWFYVAASAVMIYLLVRNGMLTLRRSEVARRATDEALQLEHGQFLSILDGIDQPVYVADPEKYEILYANKALRSQFGMDIVGKACYRVLQGRHDPCDFCTSPQIFGAHLGETHVWEVQNKVNRRWYHCMDRAIKWPDGRWVHYEMAIDITERRRAEEELARHREHLEEVVEQRSLELKRAQEALSRQANLAVLGRVAGGLAHELRNPLAAITSAVYYLNMTLGNDLKDKAARHLQTVEEYAERANRVISAILDFTQGLPAERAARSLRPILDRARVEAELPVTVQVAYDLPDTMPEVRVDDRQMVVVFRNLLVNAAQAMPSGGTIRVGAFTDDKVVGVTVTDTGVGIKPEHMNQLIEPLFSTKVIGIGLGLAVSKTFVEANGGTIAVESTVGKGTTFTLHLPAVQKT